MNERDKYHQLYDRLLDEVKLLHERIKVGIRQGLKMLVIVPLVCMLIMFLTQGSKGIFLVLWIVSMFVIAAFLIALEYVDYGIQKRLTEITGMESTLEEDPLMPELDLPDIDIEELRLIAQERRSQLPLHKLKDKLAGADASEEAEEAPVEDAVSESDEPIIEAPFIFEELPAEAEEQAAAAEIEEAEPVQAEEPETEEAAPAAEGSSENEDAEDVVKV